MEEGTMREVQEEACATVEIRSLLATYSVARIGQVHIVYLAEMSGPNCAAGAESLEVRLFPLSESALPWTELAFPVNRWALKDFLSLNGAAVSEPFTTRPEHQHDRLAPERFHPDFPPPGET